MLDSGTASALVHRIILNPVQSALVCAAALPFIYLIINEFVRAFARIPRMKGPSGLPLVGNIWDIRINAADKYRQWSKQYGAVYQIMLGNIPVVVINSAASAKTIFGSNAQVLSSRPELYTFHKVSFPGQFFAHSLLSNTFLFYGYGQIMANYTHLTCRITYFGY